VDKNHPAVKVDFSFPPPKKYNYNDVKNSKSHTW